MFSRVGVGEHHPFGDFIHNGLGRCLLNNSRELSQEVCREPTGVSAGVWFLLAVVTVTTVITVSAGEYHFLVPDHLGVVGVSHLVENENLLYTAQRLLSSQEERRWILLSPGVVILGLAHSDEIIRERNCAVKCDDTIRFEYPVHFHEESLPVEWLVPFGTSRTKRRVRVDEINGVCLHPRYDAMDVTLDEAGRTHAVCLGLGNVVVGSVILRARRVVVLAVLVKEVSGQFHVKDHGDELRRDAVALQQLLPCTESSADSRSVTALARTDADLVFLVEL